MQGEIIDEEQEWIGVKVIDNNEVEHKIAVELAGDIRGHSQDGYPDDPSKRTIEEGEYVSQARRYAKWYVYRERGHDTVPPTENPDRILATLAAIVELSESEFADHFGDLQTQLESHYDGGPVELPFANADPDDVLIYRKDVYLQPDPTDFDPPVLDQFLARFSGNSDSPVVAAKDTLATKEFDNLTFDIEAVSGMHYLHSDEQGTERTERGSDPLEREPDTTIELMAFDLSEIDSFHHYVVSHLAYQIRDRFLLMGVKPPVAFRATGWGTYYGFRAQTACPQYEEYWSSSTTVASWEPS